MSHFLFFFLSLNFLVVISRIPTSTSTSHLSLPPVPSLCGLFVWRKLSRLWHFPVSRVTSASCIPPICLELGSLALLQAPFGPGLGNLQGGRDHPRKTRPPPPTSGLLGGAGPAGSPPGCVVGGGGAGEPWPRVVQRLALSGRGSQALIGSRRSQSARV